MLEQSPANRSCKSIPSQSAAARRTAAAIRRQPNACLKPGQCDCIIFQTIPCNELHAAVQHAKRTKTIQQQQNAWVRPLRVCCTTLAVACRNRSSHRLPACVSCARAHACCFTAHTFPVQCAVLRSHLCWVVQPSPVLQAEHTQADKLSTHAEPKTTRRTHFLHDLLLTSARQAQA